MSHNIADMHWGILLGFGIVILIMLLLDLGVFNRKAHVVSSKESIVWSIVWIGLSMIFSGVIYWTFNQDEGGHALAIDKFTQYQAAYWIEKAMSVDNLFVFILVFSYFKVPKHLEHKVLFWGVLGAIIFRAIFIFAGVGLIKITDLNKILSHFGAEQLPVNINLVLTIFGVFLVYAGIHSWGEKKEEEEKDLADSIGVRLVKKFYKISTNYDGGKFFTVQNGIKMATPLFLVLSVIEITDIMFAVDSIPAIFAISDDPFILYTSNIFAILGLRSLYFLLANFIDKFSKLPYGLSIILTFIGIKMLIAPWVHISSPVSLAVIGGVLIISVLLSLVTAKKES